MNTEKSINTCLFSHLILYFIPLTSIQGSSRRVAQIKRRVRIFPVGAPGNKTCISATMHLFALCDNNQHLALPL